MIIHFKIIGILLMSLALVHVLFPRYFNWKAELSAISLINRQVMYVHTFFIGLVVFMMGILYFSSSEELMGSQLGKQISLFLFIFWGCRLFIQIFGYSSTLWKGKKFETAVHIAFLFLWTYITVISLLSYTHNQN